MWNRTLAYATAITLFATTLGAADAPPCPCVPHEAVWLVDACATWNCASSALILADGSPNVFAVPTASRDYPWIVVRRVGSGSVTMSPDAPFEIRQFGTMADGSASFEGVDKAKEPILMTTTDGAVLLISLREAQAELRPRSARH